MREIRYSTPHGITVLRRASKISYRKGLRGLLRDLDSVRGVYLSSGYEFPGRYSRWDFASTCPPLELDLFHRKVEFRPLNERGERITESEPVLAGHPHWDLRDRRRHTAGILKPMPALFSEEERSKQPSVFSILRALIAEFRDPRTIPSSRSSAHSATTCCSSSSPSNSSCRAHGVKDLHLYFCDDIWFMDRKREQIERYQYEFERDGISTAGIPRTAAEIAPPHSSRAGAHHLRPHARGVHGEWSKPSARA